MTEDFKELKDSKLLRPRKIIVQIGLSYEEGGFPDSFSSDEYRIDEIILCPLDHPGNTEKMCKGLNIPIEKRSNVCFIKFQEGFMNPANMEQVIDACHYTGPVLKGGDDAEELWTRFCNLERHSAFHKCNLKIKTDGSYGDFSFIVTATLDSNGLDLRHASLLKTTSIKDEPSRSRYGSSYRVVVNNT